VAERVIASLESRLHGCPRHQSARPRRRVGKTLLPAPQPIAGKPPTGEIATRQAYGEGAGAAGRERRARARAGPAT